MIGRTKDQIGIDRTDMMIEGMIGIETIIERVTEIDMIIETILILEVIKMQFIRNLWITLLGAPKVATDGVMDQQKMLMNKN